MLAEHLGVNHRIVFLKWLDHIQDAISIIDVAVLPTFYDASSRFILEVLAAGKPVITSRFNGAAELFKNNRHGKVVMQPENVTELANAMAWFAENDNLHNATAAIVADGFRKQVSVERAARQLLTVYESVLEKKARN